MLINEVAKLANMSKDGIRHYEEMGLITSSPKPAGGRIYRDYDLSVVDTIEKVRQARQLGFTLKEIGPLFKAYATMAPLPPEAMIGFLEARLAVIRQKITDLQAVEAFILGKIEGYRQPDDVS